MTAAADRAERMAGAGDSTTDAARRWLDHHGLPDHRDEAWRSAPLEQIDARLAAAVPASAGAVPDDAVHRLAGQHSPTRIVLVNGHHGATGSSSVRSGGLWCGPASQLPHDERARLLPPDRFAEGFHALNHVANDDPLVITVPPGHEVGVPIQIVHVSAAPDGPAVAHPRVVVHAHAGSRLSLIETFVGDTGDGITNAVTEIRVDGHASVTHHRVQLEPEQSVHLGHTLVHQGEGSHYRLTTVNLGAGIARHAIPITLAEDHSHVELTGLAVPTARQHHDTVVTVDHRGSHGTSTQRFKAIADDRARSAFTGRVVVRPGTVGSNATQSSRNLVLSPTASADTRPWLEILADDVACTHGATVGQLDEEALFYLRSRGLSAGESRRLLVEAFAGEILAAVEPVSLRDQLGELVTAGLGGRP